MTISQGVEVTVKILVVLNMEYHDSQLRGGSDCKDTGSA